MAKGVRLLTPRIKRAQLVAEAVCVLCPHCGEPQPSRNGSEMWTHEDFLGGATTRECVSCDGPMIVSPDPKVQF